MSRIQDIANYAHAFSVIPTIEDWRQHFRNYASALEAHLHDPAVKGKELDATFELLKKVLNEVNDPIVIIDFLRAATHCTHPSIRKQLLNTEKLSRLINPETRSTITNLILQVLRDEKDPTADTLDHVFKFIKENFLVDTSHRLKKEITTAYVEFIQQAGRCTTKNSFTNIVQDLIESKLWFCGQLGARAVNKPDILLQLVRQQIEGYANRDRKQPTRTNLLSPLEVARLALTV